MKINPSSIDRLLSGEETKATRDSATAQPASMNPKTGRDRIDLSPQSTQIAALESTLAAEPRFDRPRVEAIKQAIVDGQLTIDVEVMADKMIACALATHRCSK
jgi:negative regulator of flagellin synthesis FlgM